MAANIELIAAKLTPAERKAIREAVFHDSLQGWYVRAYNDDEKMSVRTRMPVIASLVSKGLTSRKFGFQLLKLGIQVREHLIAQEGK